MNPVAFNVFGIDVRWYGIIMSIAIVSGVLLAMRNGKKAGYKEDDILDICLFAIPLAVVGARLYYVAFNFELYQDNIMQIFNTRLGGMAIHGGLIGGVLGGVLVTIKKKINTVKMVDIATPSVILGQAIGRWGNFVNQEAHGGPTDLPWGITIDGVKVHPTFLYESIWNLIIFFVLMKVFKNKKYDGQMAAIYLIGYSIGRFFIEGLRTDSLMLGPLRMAQVISLGMIGAGIAIHLYFKDKGVKEPYKA
ncbi:prolipoprotein diacylglyceryl transferase [Acetoanaerobium pronyense]|uniref:Phosphatidylglycerol--prolipoprotein diacylglyceryl transferase n=1 Tax=Acetoanaerobium pronyense TaxID=1482736 RepID=A0ABS4KFZ9_9FIRM|nr:prolipoprotein diacylglyceryl transferase [Acetoanaerobium pronyense]MBP2026677.1 prolipoprotein diacylglyceryl transferase [Acetoanaerobium pronyense]